MSDSRDFFTKLWILLKEGCNTKAAPPAKVVFRNARLLIIFNRNRCITATNDTRYGIRALRTDLPHRNW